MHTHCLPVFEAAFVEAGAVNAMCSYNSINGIPCAAHGAMPGFVRADLGAIAQLHTR